MMVRRCTQYCLCRCVCSAV